MTGDSAQGIAERLQYAAAVVGGLPRLAKLTGIPPRSLHDYVNGKKMPADRAALIAAAAKLDVEWFITGGGPRTPMIRDSGQLVWGEESLDDEEKLALRGYALLPRFDVSASAGSGLFADEERIVDYMAFRNDWIRRAIGSDPGSLCLITALGDSMEPTIRSGDLLLIDRSIDRILDDAIYVIVRSEVLVVKRIQRFFKGAIVIKSDNPSYVDETLDAGELDELRVAGRVRWIARMI